LLAGDRAPQRVCDLSRFAEHLLHERSRCSAQSRRPRTARGLRVEPYVREWSCASCPTSFPSPAQWGGLEPCFGSSGDTKRKPPTGPGSSLRPELREVAAVHPAV
jgi:hypothetical protein